MADRILVFRGGRVVARVRRAARSIARRCCSPPRMPCARRGAPALAGRMSRYGATAERRRPGASRGLVGRALRVRELGLVLALLVICALVTPARAALPRRRQPRAGRALGDARLHRRARPGAGHHRPADRSLGRRDRRHERVRRRRLAGGPPGRLACVIVFLIGLRASGWRSAWATRCSSPSSASRRSSRRSARSPIYRGGVIVFAGGRQISATVLPDSYEDIARIDLAGVPLLVWLAILLTVAVRLDGALHAHRAQSLCARQQPGERAPRRHQRALARRLRVHAVRPAVRAGRRALGRALRHGRCRASRPTCTCRRSRPW